MNNNTENKEIKPKWTKARIIKIILYTVILALVIFLLVVSCNKNKVKAYDSFVRTTLTTNDLEVNNGTQTSPKAIYASSFYIYNLNDIYNGTTPIFYVQPKQNDNNVPYTFNVRINSFGSSDGYGLYVDIYENGNLAYYDLGWQINHVDDILVCGIYYYNNFYYYYIYKYNSTQLGENISVKLFESSYGFYQSNLTFNISINSPLWTRDVLTKNNTYSFNEAIAYLVRSDTPTNLDPFEYRQEYLFGDLVSSFLNIKFANVNIGGTTFDLTIGLLLLFILGIGALFIIIKIFLGG